MIMCMRVSMQAHGNTGNHTPEFVSVATSIRLTGVLKANAAIFAYKYNMKQSGDAPSVENAARLVVGAKALAEA